MSDTPATGRAKRAKRPQSRWVYEGDVHLREGGFYFRDDGSDSIGCVDVIPESVIGGPDNIFRIETGWVSLSGDSESHARALQAYGASVTGPTRLRLILALKALRGLESPARFYVQIGHAIDPHWQGEGRGYALPVLDAKLRANASLRNFVRQTFLR